MQSIVGCTSTTRWSLFVYSNDGCRSKLFGVLNKQYASTFDGGHLKWQLVNIGLENAANPNAEPRRCVRC